MLGNVGALRGSDALGSSGCSEPRGGRELLRGSPGMRTQSSGSGAPTTSSSHSSESQGWVQLPSDVMMRRES